MSDFNEQTEAQPEEVVEVEVVAEEAAAPAEEITLEATIQEMPVPVQETPKPKKAKASKKAKPAAGRSFKRGDVGAAIREIQAFLNSKNISCPQSGIFCTHTYDAVKKYQVSIGVEATGIAGEEILSSL
jgi:peptidoglycan hydrolase-like protein with peptidoglycan-binding domain